MEIGTIKWFSDIKNFGFIERESGADLFVHSSALSHDLPERLDGLRVSFEVVPSAKKPGKFCAAGVRLAKT